jgi:hypothetical protein
LHRYRHWDLKPTCSKNLTTQISAVEEEEVPEEEEPRNVAPTTRLGSLLLGSTIRCAGIKGAEFLNMHLDPNPISIEYNKDLASSKLRFSHDPPQIVRLSPYHS